MPLDTERGTNEYYGDEDEKDDYEPDYDADNDMEWLDEQEIDPDDEHYCCRGECK